MIGIVGGRGERLILFAIYRKIDLNVNAKPIIFSLLCFIFFFSFSFLVRWYPLCARVCSFFSTFYYNRYRLDGWPMLQYL